MRHETDKLAADLKELSRVTASIEAERARLTAAMGEQAANMMLKKCGADTQTSHKVAIVQGVLTGGVSYYQVQGMMKVFNEHPEIQIVSSQAADWDASKARAITETALQQHPDLCGVIDVWDGQGIGTGAAIKQAGKQEPDGIRIDFPVSKQDLAEMTGTTLYTVSRILTAWQEAGIVDGGRQKLLVRDPHRLLLIADGIEAGRLR